jgi:CRP-like cAMP-binding protein
MQKPSAKTLSLGEVLGEADSRRSPSALTEPFPRTRSSSPRATRPSLYIVVSGRVKVYVSDDKGKRSSSMRLAGEYFGELMLDEGRSRFQ